MNVTLYTPVYLTDAEWEYALDLGYRREMQNRDAGRKHAYGADAKDGMKMHKDGALHEVASAKGINVPYRETKLREPDLLHNVQVRGRSMHWHDLLVHEEILPTGKPGDSPRDRFVLITREDSDRTREFRLHGWCWGAEAQLSRFWKDPARGRPAFFVPKRDPTVREIETLFVAPRKRGFRIVAWD